ncbi:LysR family transcriptional regulator [Oceanospirillum beijerinckii]|uniref:LysR family transcriptional regulator n=1 Tax=Oceanospirillum beijerinckii TaxID=64976 RepID=UPI000483F86F|nr:LysR family transcriptional regulator [Oceanospirillum beijerinckii]
MELISLKTFKAVVDEAGIKGASDKLNTVQSNISSRIQRLEQELGVRLFQLKGRKLELTANGKLLYPYACQILQLEKQAKDAIRIHEGQYELVIGTPETFAAIHLPRALKGLRREHSHIQPRIYTATSGQLISAVKNNTVDCAFVGGHIINDDFVSIPAVVEKMVKITASDGHYDPVLFVRGEGCGYRQAALAWQREMGNTEQQLMEMSSVDGVLGCVAAGLGYTIMGWDMVRNNRYEDSLAVEALTDHHANLQISLIYKNDCLLETGIQALASFFAP